MTSIQATQYYKYRPLYTGAPDKTGKREIHPHTKSILKDARVYFSAPCNFNDPFDCNLKLHVQDSTDAEWEAYLRPWANQDPNIHNALVNQAWKTNPALFQNAGGPTLKTNYVESSVLCFAKNGKSVPMFAYYADDHRGIAIEFTIAYQDAISGFKGPTAGLIIAKDVSYPDLFPDLNYHRIRNDADRMIETMLFTKSSEWKHEREFRIFRRQVPECATSFERTFITRIVFGYRTTEEDILLVKDWLKGWPSDVVLAKAKPANDKFELLIEDFGVVRGTVSSTQP
jgi:hypothetical protein